MWFQWTSFFKTTYYLTLFHRMGSQNHRRFALCHLPLNVWPYQSFCQCIHTTIVNKKMLLKSSWGPLFKNDTSIKMAIFLSGSRKKYPLQVIVGVKVILTSSARPLVWHEGLLRKKQQRTVFFCFHHWDQTSGYFHSVEVRSTRWLHLRPIERTFITEITNRYQISI